VPFVIESKRKSLGSIQRQYPGAPVIDVTSKAPMPFVKFSPFYPHGNIPVLLSPGQTAASVEGIWQGLKVFANAGIDLGTMKNASMKGIKRTVRKNGPVKGHQAGINSKELLDYRTARFKIYLPAYRWILDNCLQSELGELRLMGETRPVVLLDYETNIDLDNLRKPLSHASLIVKYLNREWPK